MSEQDSNSCFDINDLMADYYANNYHYVLDSDPENFVEAYATFNGLNGLTISFYVNNMTVSVRNHILDSEGNFSLSSMVEIQRSNLNENTRMIDIIYNQSVIYSYPIVRRRPNDQTDSDTNDAVNPEDDPMDQSDDDTESLPELEPADHDEALVPEEPAAEATAASSADAKGSDKPAEAATASSADAKVSDEPAATTETVDFLPGYDTPHSPLGSDDEFLQGYDTPYSPLMSDEEDFRLSSLFGYSNPPSLIEDRPQTPDVEDGYSMDGMAGSNPQSDQGLPSDPPSDDLLLYPDDDEFFRINADRVEDDAKEE